MGIPAISGYFDGKELPMIENPAAPMFRRGLVAWAILVAGSFSARGQDAAETGTNPGSGHRLTIMMANSHIPAANDLDGQDRFFVVPAWGFNYDYWFSPRIALGVHNDIILQQYKIEKHSDRTTIERSFPVVVSAMVLYKPCRRWTFEVGAGGEFEQSENFSLVTAGTDYGIELRDGWELGFNLIYELKLDAYDSWMFGISFSKLFPSR